MVCYKIFSHVEGLFPCFRLRDGRAFKNKNIIYENRIAKYVITETTETSTGTYTCQATNDAGYAETSCKLKIQGEWLPN